MPNDYRLEVDTLIHAALHILEEPFGDVKRARELIQKAIDTIGGKDHGNLSQEVRHLRG